MSAWTASDFVLLIHGLLDAAVVITLLFKRPRAALGRLLVFGRNDGPG